MEELSIFWEKENLSIVFRLLTFKEFFVFAECKSISGILFYLLKLRTINYESENRSN